MESGNTNGHFRSGMRFNRARIVWQAGSARSYSDRRDPRRVALIYLP